MGLMDALNPEDRIEIKLSTIYELMKSTAEANAKLHYIENAITAKVPNFYIQGMLTGAPRTTFIDGPIFGEGIDDDDI